MKDWIDQFWAQYDEMVDAFSAGITIIGAIFGIPRWMVRRKRKNDADGMGAVERLSVCVELRVKVVDAMRVANRRRATAPDNWARGITVTGDIEQVNEAEVVPGNRTVG